MVSKFETALAAIVLHSYEKNMAIMNMPDEVLATLVANLKQYFGAMLTECLEHVAQDEDGNE